MARCKSKAYLNSILPMMVTLFNLGHHVVCLCNDHCSTFLWTNHSINKNPLEHASKTDSGQPAQAYRFLMPKAQVLDVWTSLCKCNLWWQSN